MACTARALRPITRRLRYRTPITAAAISSTISGVAAGPSEVWRAMGAALAAAGAASATAVVAAAMRRASMGALLLVDVS